MTISDIEPLEVLRDALIEYGVKQTIYVGNKPTDSLPDEFIELRQNGGLRTNLSKMGLVQGYILLSVNVRLMDGGGRNTTREKLITATFDGLFENGRAIYKDGYTFSLDPNNLVYYGGGVFDGFGSRLINIKLKKENYGNK